MRRPFLLLLFICVSRVANAQNTINHKNAGDSLVNTGSFTSAIESYTKAISDNLNDKSKLSELYSKRSLAESAVGQYLKAADDGSLSIAANPRYANAYWSRGSAFYYQKFYNKAIEDYQKAIDLYKDVPSAQAILYSKLAQCNYGLKLYQKALDYTDKALELDSASGDAYEQRGLIYYRIGSFQLAVTAFSRAAKLLKDSPVLSSTLYQLSALSRKKIMQYQDAIADCDSSLNLNQKNIGALLVRATIYTDIGEFQLAENDYKDCISKLNTPKARAFATDVFEGKAMSDFCLNLYKDAIDNCKKAINIDSNRYYAYYVMAKSQLKLSLRDSAISNFKKVLQLDTSKKSTSYIFSLFYTGDPEAALKVLGDQIKAPKNPYDLTVSNYNMACLCALLNNEEQTISYLKKALGSGYPVKYAIFDEDFNNIKNTQQFKEITKN
ncbi:MAG TPA: tetratricopeptide repeat protein [Mucilaginibacter sp.]|nr:tetratricopeptide repeat protein [Mucilaginibacter sp.]